jgi:hypothetical protein
MIKPAPVSLARFVGFERNMEADDHGDQRTLGRIAERLGPGRAGELHLEGGRH